MPVQHPAGLPRRLASLLYEALVIFGILLVGFLFPQALMSGFGIALSPRLLWAHIFLLLMGYFVWFWVNGGQTLAMKTWKLRIVDASGGRRLRLLQAILRYLAAWLGAALLGVGFLWALVDREGQFLHDRIAGTRIIFDPD